MICSMCHKKNMFNVGLVYVVQLIKTVCLKELFKRTLTFELQSGTRKKEMKHLSNGRTIEMMMTSRCVEELASIDNCYLFWTIFLGSIHVVVASVISSGPWSM